MHISQHRLIRGSHGRQFRSKSKGSSKPPGNRRYFTFIEIVPTISPNILPHSLFFTEDFDVFLLILMICCHRLTYSVTLIWSYVTPSCAHLDKTYFFTTRIRGTLILSPPIHIVGGYVPLSAYGNADGDS